MLKDLLVLYRKRWPEMMLIVGFCAFGIFLLERFNANLIAVDGDFNQLTGTPAFWYSLGGMVFGVLWIMFLLGFLVSITIKSQMALEPVVLLKIGRRYFWRLFRYFVIYGVLCIAITMVVFTAVARFLFPAVDANSIPLWVVELCAIPAYLMLAKPLVLVPCIMIVRNCMVMEATSLISDYAIFKSKALLAIFTAAVLVDRAFSVIVFFVDIDSAAFFVLIGVKGWLIGELMLATGLCGVWFVNGGKFNEDLKKDLEISEAT